jgi:hypothetical protein
MKSRTVMALDDKPVHALTVADLEAHPVWRYLPENDERDETFVRPVKRIPVSSLAGKIVGTQVLLANGQRIWAIISNVDHTNARLTQHFLTLSVERNGSWFFLARYHDFDRAKRGPKALAKLLGLSVAEVFPITYDIRSYAKGSSAALSGEITKTPKERLTRSQVIGLAVGD